MTTRTTPTTPTCDPAAVSGRTPTRHGSMSTVEIKARIAAMYADDRPRSRPASR
jgi:hypothetical protein